MNANGNLLLWSLGITLAGAVILLIAAILSHISAIRSPWVHRGFAIVGSLVVLAGLVLLAIDVMSIMGLYRLEDKYPALARWATTG